MYTNFVLNVPIIRAFSPGSITLVLIYTYSCKQSYKHTRGHTHTPLRITSHTHILTPHTHSSSHRDTITMHLDTDKVTHTKVIIIVSICIGSSKPVQWYVVLAI